MKNTTAQYNGVALVCVECLSDLHWLTPDEARRDKGTVKLTCPECSLKHWGTVAELKQWCEDVKKGVIEKPIKPAKEETEGETEDVTAQDGSGAAEEPEGTNDDDTGGVDSDVPDDRDEAEAAAG